MKQQHPFHMVYPSPWPLFLGLSSSFFLSSSVIWFMTKESTLVILNMFTMTIICVQWWRDVSRESSMQGYHTKLVMNGLRYGMMLFIISEVLFFFSFFWSFFHSSLAPNFELGNTWPPMNVEAINPFQVPLLNTTILLTSGVTVTLSHHLLIKKMNVSSKNLLLITILLGTYFTALQAWEYMESSFTISDSSYGSTFFLATGFHGFHVIVGTIFLTAALFRQKMMFFSNNHHFGLEAAIWYWHFVDVVWLFLYTFIYWWSF